MQLGGLICEEKEAEDKCGHEKISQIFDMKNANGHKSHRWTKRNEFHLRRWCNNDQMYMDFVQENWSDPCFHPFKSIEEAQTFVVANPKTFIIRLSSTKPGHLALTAVTDDTETPQLYMERFKIIDKLICIDGRKLTLHECID